MSFVADVVLCSRPSAAGWGLKGQSPSQAGQMAIIWRSLPISMTDSTEGTTVTQPAIFQQVEAGIECGDDGREGKLFARLMEEKVLLSLPESPHGNLRSRFPNHVAEVDVFPEKKN